MKLFSSPKLPPPPKVEAMKVEDPPMPVDTVASKGKRASSRRRAAGSSIARNRSLSGSDTMGSSSTTSTA